MFQQNAVLGIAFQKCLSNAFCGLWLNGIASVTNGTRPGTCGTQPEVTWLDGSVGFRINPNRVAWNSQKRRVMTTQASVESRKRNRGKRRRRRSQKSQQQKQKKEELSTSDIIENEEEEEEKSAAKQPKSKRRKTDERSNSISFLDKMRASLSGGHFRMISEKLYTCSGNEALNYFKEDPALFNMYHIGYQEQMSRWPEQPVNIIIRWLKDHSPSLIVADFGCGDACLARNVKNKVFSIDLVSNDPSVIACDMSNTPLESSSVDVAVFCLSLMGTNFSCYLQEAHRVLKPCGWLLIAEVKSRFDPTTGGADPNEFLKAICELGFSSVTKDFSNKMFILFYFKKKDKQSRERNQIKWPKLKPCVYKRR